MGVGPLDEARIGGVAVGEAFGQIGREREHAVVRRADPSQQGHASGGEAAEVDGLAAMGAGDHRQQPRRPALFHRGLIDPQLAQPPDQVAATVAPRQPGVAADREIDAAAGAQQFIGDLRADAPEPTTSTAPGGSWSGLR